MPGSYSKYLFFSCLFVLTSSVFSQVVIINGVARDTSFTSLNELRKHQVYYPGIKLVGLGDTSQLTILENIPYTFYSNRALHLDVIYHSVFKEKPIPVVVLIHGGGWRSGDKTIEHPMAMELARRGYAAVCVEYRLSPEAIYPAAVEDVIAAVRWVKANANANQFPFDVHRIALYGTSAGGQLASLIGAINGDTTVFNSMFYREFNASVNAVVNVDGILAFVHPDSDEGQDRPGRPSAATDWLGASIVENPPTALEASALTHVNSNSAPMLFINSSIARFGAGRDDMIRELNKYDIYSRKYQHQDCMHTFWLFHPWFDQTVEWVDEFLQKVLYH